MVINFALKNILCVCSKSHESNIGFGLNVETSKCYTNIYILVDFSLYKFGKDIKQFFIKKKYY